MENQTEETATKIEMAAGRGSGGIGFGDLEFIWPIENAMCLAPQALNRQDVGFSLRVGSLWFAGSGLGSKLLKGGL